jgi:hypothetical protein
VPIEEAQADIWYLFIWLLVCSAVAGLKGNKPLRRFIHNRTAMAVRMIFVYKSVFMAFLLSVGVRDFRSRLSPSPVVVKCEIGVGSGPVSIFSGTGRMAKKFNDDP